MSAVDAALRLTARDDANGVVPAPRVGPKTGGTSTQAASAPRVGPTNRYS